MAADVFAEVAREPGVPKPDPILVADAIRRSFGGLAAVDVAHVEVQRNTITALIGPNGAGKTTFFNLLTGFDTPSTGTWHFNGMSMSGASPYKAARRGMVRTFQLTKSLTRMTVIENMRLAPLAKAASGCGPRRSGSCGVSRKPRSLLAPRSCSSASSWTTCVTSSVARCRVGSASSWKWRER